MTVITTKDAAFQCQVCVMMFNNYLRRGYLPSARKLSNGNWIVTQEMVTKLIADKAAGLFPKRGPHRKTKPAEVFETFVGTKRM